MSDPLVAPPPSDAPSNAPLSELYASYAADLFRLAYRLTGSSADAEDVVQDVFLGLPHALRGYDERGRFGAWLRTLTARTALSRLRRRTRRREVVLDAAVSPMTCGHAEAVVSHVTLQRALAQLPETLRSVLVLREMEGYSHAEIAELLGIGVSASQVRLHRAHEKLRTILRSQP
jgi:RNA polymerase sigma-70 factor (ECF subfamily)